VDNSYQRQYGGTGLGLPLTKKLIEMHGGQIFLLSKEGVGTEIVFTLPLDSGPVVSDMDATPGREG
jgi:signal transduction histidine kinase